MNWSGLTSSQYNFINLQNKKKAKKAKGYLAKLLQGEFYLDKRTFAQVLINDLHLKAYYKKVCAHSFTFLG